MKCSREWLLASPGDLQLGSMQPRGKYFNFYVHWAKFAGFAVFSETTSSAFFRSLSLWTKFPHCVLARKPVRGAAGGAGNWKGGSSCQRVNFFWGIFPRNFQAKLKLGSAGPGEDWIVSEAKSCLRSKYVIYSNYLNDGQPHIESVTKFHLCFLFVMSWEFFISK